MKADKEALVSSENGQSVVHPIPTPTVDAFGGPSADAQGVGESAPRLDASDRALLEMAAKAAGYKVHSNDERAPGAYIVVPETNRRAERTYHWNPLHDDGDALRLAVKLGIYWRRYGNVLEICRTHEHSIVRMFDEAVGADVAAATRRAIVRAAAAIGSQQ